MQIKLELNHQQLLDLLEQLPEDEFQALLVEIEAKKKAKTKLKKRPFGVLNGKIWMAEDFNAPLVF
ncbi:MAG: DUF2281 domain-containing protein [Microscillaceae bacterium]|jgi:hypothetical protein|nr:DUF2281 domain-containing protein [Microscillaceae bacterium]